MRALITGAAGFVGSHLSEELLASGHSVRGIDCFTPYYNVERKRQNISLAMQNDDFELIEADLRTADLASVLDGVDVVFHQAAQPGVRLSWSEGFATYDELNVFATQRLLEAVKNSNVSRFVYASSSSVYGNATRYPTVETDLPAPHSPYGVTKLAAEHLCNLYAANWGLSTVSLRYFTVFGPRQRPDMAMHRLVSAALNGTSFPLNGDGSAIRDFTFVGDVVAANMAAATADVKPGTVVNIAGTESVTMKQLMAMVEDAAETKLQITHMPEQPGDVKRTGGSTDLAKKLLGWEPKVSTRQGVQAHVDWMKTVSEPELTVSL